MSKVAVSRRWWPHPGGTGAFVLPHRPPHRLPFMYPDGAQFDLLCLCPRLCISASHSFSACRRSPANTRTRWAHPYDRVAPRRTIRPFQVLHFCCSDDLFALPLLSPLNVRGSRIFNELINSCSGPTQVKQIFNLNSVYFRDYFNTEVNRGPQEVQKTSHKYHVINVLHQHCAYIIRQDVIKEIRFPVKFRLFGVLVMEIWFYE